MPGKAEGNWRWRFQKGQIDQQARERLAELTAVYSRWNGAIPQDLDPRCRPENLDQVAGAGDPPEHETSDGALNVRNQMLVLGMNLVVKNLDDVSDRDDAHELVSLRTGTLAMWRSLILPMTSLTSSSRWQVTG